MNHQDGLSGWVLASQIIRICSFINLTWVGTVHPEQQEYLTYIPWKSFQQLAMLSKHHKRQMADGSAVDPSSLCFRYPCLGQNGRSIDRQSIYFHPKKLKSLIYLPLWSGNSVKITGLKYSTKPSEDVGSQPQKQDVSAIENSMKTLFPFSLDDILLPL